MRLVFISYLLLLMACQSTPVSTPKNESVSPVTQVVAETQSPQEAGYHFYIMGENIQDGDGVLFDTISPVNELSLLGGNLNARLVWDIDSVQYLALSQRYGKDHCFYYRAEILEMLESNEYRDVTEQFFPELDVYAFYDFSDQAVKQFEGDEQTVFAGYRFDFSKADSLGIQFMFCNQQDPADSKLLNKNGQVIYRYLRH